jgi:hypothetical protein
MLADRPVRPDGQESFVRNAFQHHANFTALEALICAGRIAKRTASCYMLLYYYWESILFGPELLSSRF